MLIQHWFSALMEQLERIRRIYPAATLQQKKDLHQQLNELRYIGDSVLELWLSFEEELSRISDMLSQSSEIETEEDGEQTLNILSEAAARHFRMGQGYYDLRMFEQSIPHFHEVVQQEPELHVARLYLALGYYHAGHIDRANIHLNVITTTEEHPIIQALAHNLKGCILAKQNQAEGAIFHFSKAIEDFPELHDASFNYVLMSMELAEYDRAIVVLRELIQNGNEDWEVLLLLCEAYRANGQVHHAEELLQQMKQYVRHGEGMARLALQYEQHGMFLQAAQCYENILQSAPDKSWAWHGMAWNQWLHHQNPSCLMLLKRAISLNPKNYDYWFSYGWILQQSGEEVKAARVWKQILRQQPDHVLALSACILEYSRRGKTEQALQLCRRLLDHPVREVKGLGYHHLGKICLTQGDYERATPHFSRSIELTGNRIRENHLYKGICHFFLGEKNEASRLWKELLEV